MNNSPGWASPGSAASDPQQPETTAEPPEPTEQLEPTDQAQQPDHAKQRGQAEGEPSKGAVDTTPPNWSKNQPPASHGWGALPAQEAPGQARWAAPGGPGRYRTPPPPAARPGVIPLRPLAVGEILEGAFSTIRVHWRPVLSISFVVALLTQAVSTLVTVVFFKHASTSFGALRDNPNPSPGDALHTLSGAFAGSGVSSAVSVAGQLVATAMLTMIVSRSVLGRPVSAGEAWRESFPRLMRLVGMTASVALVAALAVGIGAAPGILLAAVGSVAGGVTLAVLGGFAGVIAAIWLVIRLSLATPALMLEKQGVFDSLARSAKLVRGAWWRVFGIQLLASVIVFIVTSVIAIPFTAIGAVLGGDGAHTLLTNSGTPTSWPFLLIVGIGTVIGTTITFPVSAGVTALLYMDQRIRREGLDIELARAAGVQGY